MPRCRVPVLARVVAHLGYWQAGRGVLCTSRCAHFSCMACSRHRRVLHVRRLLLLFACVVDPVRLLDICRVDRLMFSMAGCHRRFSLFCCLYHFRGLP